MHLYIVTHMTYANQEILSKPKATGIISVATE